MLIKIIRRKFGFNVGYVNKVGLEEKDCSLKIVSNFFRLGKVCVYLDNMSLCF